jgi:hypothetical protein
MYADFLNPLSVCIRRADAEACIVKFIEPIVLIPHDVFLQYFELNDSTPTKRKHYELAEEYSDYEVSAFLDFFVSRGVPDPAFITVLAARIRIVK